MNTKPTHKDDNGNLWALISGHWHRQEECAEGWVDWVKDDSSAPNRRPIQKEMKLLEILLESGFEWPSDDSANYVAQDDDGDIWSFERKPTCNNRGYWVEGYECDYINTYTKASDRLERVVSRGEYVDASKNAKAGDGCISVEPEFMPAHMTQSHENPYGLPTGFQVNAKAPDFYEVDVSEDDCDGSHAVSIEYTPEWLKDRGVKTRDKVIRKTARS